MSEENAVMRLSGRSDVRNIEVDGNGIHIEMHDDRVGGPFNDFCSVMSWIVRPAAKCSAAVR